MQRMYFLGWIAIMLLLTIVLIFSLHKPWNPAALIIYYAMWGIGMIVTYPRAKWWRR